MKGSFGLSFGFLSRSLMSSASDPSQPARLSRLAKPLRFIGSIIIALILLAGLFWILEKTIFYLFARSYVEEVAEQLDVNKYLATAVAWVAFAATILFARYTFSFSKTKRVIGIFGFLILLVGQSLVLWYGTSNQFFSRTGEATKCYIITRDSIRYGERSGTDPVTGRECRPVTPEMVERLKAYEGGNRPKRIEIANPHFF